MEIHNIKNYIRGWFIGDFYPSILKTKDFEIGLLTHKKNENWPMHFHKISTEYNILISGKMMINNYEINVGDIFIIYPNEIANPTFIEDCKIICIKVPSIIGDKYESI